jgi:uncharacterized protein YndB with AHSA1/START domain
MQAINERQETRPRPAVPGPVGLLIRVLLGAAAVYALVELVTQWDAFRDQNLIESGFWLITLFTLCLSDVFNIGLRRRWGPWPTVIFLAGAVVLGSVGYLAAGEVWITALAAWVYAGDLLVFGALSVSFPVAIATRTPGCELNAIPRLAARLHGSADQARRCRLGVDLLDRQPTPSSRRRDVGERHVSVMIGAPPEIVFGLYTDPGRARDWLSGVREVRTAGPPDQPGSRAVFVYRWPFKMTAEVLQAEPPNLHVQRLKELLGLVTCTTTARFRRVEGGTELRTEMRYRVAGGPIGRLFGARVGDEMVATQGRDLARLKALAEEQAGPRRAHLAGPA